MLLFTAIVKDGVQFVMATNYRGLSSRRQHERFNCQPLLLWACRQPRERLMHTAELSSLLNVHHYMIKHSKAWEKSGPLTGE